MNSSTHFPQHLHGRRASSHAETISEELLPKCWPKDQRQWDGVVVSTGICAFGCKDGVGNTSKAWGAIAVLSLTQPLLTFSQTSLHCHGASCRAGAAYPAGLSPDFSLCLPGDSELVGMREGLAVWFRGVGEETILFFLSGSLGISFPLTQVCWERCTCRQN